jgi:glycerol-3-phosphate dehydrogenase (NAD(P)+)
MWGPFPEYAETLQRSRENRKFLPGVTLPKEITVVSDPGAAVNGADLIVPVVPSQYMRKTLERFKDILPEKARYVSASKGVEVDTLMRMSEVIKEVLGEAKLSVLSGPSIAYEVSRSMPTTVVVASDDAVFAGEVQKIFMAENFRVYTSGDIIGVELGGALKNIIAISSGIADGLGFGANSKAAILTRGAQEIMRLGVAMGARKETFSGLSCMGDLITTCMSKHSRNRWLGEEIGKGRKPADVIGSTEMVVEGYVTTRSAYELSKKYKVEMPITAEIYEMLYKGKDPKKAVRSLMLRAPRSENS